jgi:uncharacterized protein (TIGR03083 family)
VADLYPMVVAERRRLADALDPLTDEQWATASLCAGWTVRDVLAHLVFPATASKLKVIVPFFKSGFNFDRMTNQLVRDDTRSGPELVKVLRKHAEHRFTPPGFGFEAPLTDVVVHGRDIERPLGIPATTDPQVARAVLDFVVSKRATLGNGFVHKGVTDGLRFEATDLNWAHGDGDAVVRGQTEALMLVILGRAVALGDLSGTGVTQLQERLA